MGSLSICGACIESNNQQVVSGLASFGWIDSEIHVRFKLLHEECIEFNKLGLRDNVAQICVLESLNQNNTKDMPALPSRCVTSADHGQATTTQKVGMKPSQIMYFMADRKKELKDGDAEGGLGYLSAKFVNDSLFVFKFTVDENSCLDTLFWIDGRSRMDYAAFGNVLGLTQQWASLRIYSANARERTSTGRWRLGQTSVASPLRLVPLVVKGINVEGGSGDWGRGVGKAPPPPPMRFSPSLLYLTLPLSLDLQHLFLFPSRSCRHSFRFDLLSLAVFTTWVLLLVDPLHA
ncbi:hypothetical protein C3L33_08938, partial [Rhododendron williamsianum]